MKNRFNLLAAAFILTVYSFTGIVSASTGGSDSGNGTQTPYSLTVQALEGPSYTDLYVNLNPTSAGITAPDSLKKVQLKTFDQNNNLVYTRNYNNGVASPNGTADIQLTDVVRHQPLQTLVQVQNNQTTDTKVFNASGAVLLRPELSVDQVNAPATAYVNTPVSVSSVIKELNGDVGAVSQVQILNGDTALDTATNVQVAPGGTTPVAFLLNFSQPGTYTLRALISNVQPGEYDTTHNEKDFTIQVIQPDKMQYSSSYRYEDFNNTQSWSNYYESGNFHQSGSYDYYTLDARTSDVVDASGTFTLKLRDSNANVLNEQFSDIQLTNQYSSFKSFRGYDPTTNGSIFIVESPQGTSVSYTQYGGYYTYSENWSSWHESSSSNGSKSWGLLFKANGQISAHVELPATSGVIYGGDYTINLSTPQNFDDRHDYNWWGGYDYNDYQIMNFVGGYSSGLTTWNQ